MSEKRKIVAWSRWIDAYGLNRNQLEYVPEKEIAEDKFDINVNDRYEFEDEDEEEVCDHENQEDRPIILTPTGALPIRPFNNILNYYNFWLGETNFNISENVAQIINDAEGIELFDILGRYKFRVAIGNCFKFQDVRQDIERQLGVTYESETEDVGEANMELDQSLREQVKDIYRVHLKNHPFWAVLVLPNQKIDIALAESQTPEFTEKVETYMKSKSMVGGAVFKSWEKKHLQSLGLV